MEIKKYKLIPEYSEEYEFRIQKIKTISQEITMEMVTDDEGNEISSIGRKPPSVNSNVTERIVAWSLPSGRPAKVEILETSNVIQSPPSENVNEASKNSAQRPHINLTEQLNMMHDARVAAANENTPPQYKPIVIPKNQEISWADKNE